MANLIQAVSWGPWTNPGSMQRNYFRIPFDGAPHILATAYLDVVSIGDQDGSAGAAVAAFKRYEYLDANGQVQEQELDNTSGGRGWR